MPATREALALTDRAREDFLRHRTLLLAAAARAWDVVPPDDFDGGYRRWLGIIVPYAQAQQRAVIAASNAYLAAFVAAETGSRAQVDEAPLDAGDETHTGAPWEKALVPAVIAAKIAVRQGQAPELALRAGVRQAMFTLSTEITSAADVAASVAMSGTDRVVGWRRVPSGSACGGCLAACTGAIQESDALIPRHQHCRCHKEPVVRDARERYRRPTGEEMFQRMSRARQDALFAGRGGAAKADLVRAGDVPFADLAHRTPRGSLGDTIAETPLSTLQARAAR